MTDATATAETASAAPTPSSFYVRVGLVMGGWTTLHLGIVAALAAPALPGGWLAFGAILAFLLAAVGTLLHSFRDDVYPGKWRRLLVMRPFWYAQAALLPMSTLAALSWLAGLPFGRAVSWGRSSLVVTGALLLLLFVAGYVGSRALVVRRVSFAWPDLPEAFDGFTIAQLSDHHVGPHTSRRFLRRIARAVEDAKPDLVAHTGDQVDDYDSDVAHFVRAFGDLRAPLGVYAIAGNHDVYAHWPGVRAGLEAAGIRALVNETTRIERGGATLWLAGTGDPAGRQWGGASGVAPDIERTLAGVPEGAFVVALAHNPALWPALAARGVKLTLSGHTHHGQLSIPALRWCLASPFLEHAMGHHERGDSRLYIHPGTNHWALPLRLGAWPEVTLVTLRRSA